MFNKILKFFLENSRVNYTLFLLVFAVGIYSYIKTPKEIFPSFDLDMIVVSGHYNGASIDTLNKIIVQGLEDDLKSVQDVENITSTITPSKFSIILELKKGTNRYNTASKIKDIVNVSKLNLPSDMDDPIVETLELNKKILEISLYTDKNNTNILKQKAIDLKSVILNIKNISNVAIYGYSDKFYEILLNEKKIEALGIKLNDVYSAIKTISNIYPLGKVEDKKQHYYITTSNGAKTQSELQNTQIIASNKIIYLKDIAKISKKYKDTSTLFSLNNKNAINLIINQSATGDATKIDKQIQKVLDIFNQKNINIQSKIIDNQSKQIKERLNIVISNIILGLIIITLIVALLINIRMAIVIMIGIPTSFVIAALFFYQMGYTINLISLVGVLLALGIIIDDAMVVSENIQQYVEEGMDIKEAAIKGTTEMVKPVTIASLTTLFAFLPSLMLSGTMGEVVKLIPIALSALIIASLIESFIFLPIHAVHTLKKDVKTLSWNKANKVYSSIIHFFVKWRKSFLFVFIFGIPLLSIIILKNSHFQMFPTFDSTIIHIVLKNNVNTKLEENNKIAKLITQEILTQKNLWNIKNITTTTGHRKDSGGNKENYPYTMSISVELNQLKPQNFVDKFITPYLSFYYDNTYMTRDKTSQTISKELIKFLKDKKLKEKYNLVDLSVVQKKMGPIKADIKIGLVGDNWIKIDSYIVKLKKELNSIDGILSVSGSTSKGVEELKLNINDYGLSLGIDEGYLTSILTNKYLNIKKATTFDKDGILDINIKSFYKNDLANFKLQQIQLKNGQFVRLNEIVTFKIIKSFEKITKENGEINLYLFSNVDPKIITASEVLEKITPILNQIRKDNIKIVLKGEAKKNKELKNDMKFATTLAMVLILLSILYLFNSFKQTFIVMSVIPYSLFGVLLGHQIMGVNLGMTSMIGALGLAGVVINDGIIMMTYLKNAKTMNEMFIASTKRFRPIILTSVTTIIGVSSLIFFPTGQAVIFQPMAIALGFGLAWGTILNLIYLPVLFVFTSKLK
jgi:multidrug efflux pump subunit AcrB